MTDTMLSWNKMRYLFTPDTEGAENNLDAVLRSLLPNDPVTYVDVGAAEPVQCSNTWQFYKAGGSGLLVEPLPTWWYNLLVHRCRDRLWPAAIADSRGSAQFYMFGSGSSFDPKWVAQNEGEITVETDLLMDVLDRFPNIRDTAQLFSLDTEGYEIPILLTIDWAVFHPQVVVVEYFIYRGGDGANKPEDDARVETIARIIAPHGYKLAHRDRLNVVFNRESA